MRSRKTIAFDVRAAIAEAWDFLWADNLRCRAKAGTTYYLCAADIENQVRTFAIEALEGKPRGSTGRAYGRPCSTLRLSSNLKGAVRDWLRSHPKITSHNFGRGHISGARYRPVGEPIGPTEAKTMEAKARRKDKPRLLHFSKAGGPACTANRRHRFARQSKSWSTRDKAKVTCPRCKNTDAFKAEAVSKELENV